MKLTFPVPIVLAVALVLQVTVPALAQSNGARLERLPAARGIRRGRIRYVRSQTAQDRAVENALRRSEELRGVFSDSNDSPRYFYNTVDLSGDGVPELLVYLFGRSVCGTGGCMLLVFRPTGREDFQLVTSISTANNPILVTRNRTRGWNDLVMFVSGGGMPAHYVWLRFNRRTYPDNASIAPNVRANTVLTGTVYLADEATLNSGMILPSNQ